MFRIRTAVVRLKAFSSIGTALAPRVDSGCRSHPGIAIGFALTLLLVAGGVPVTVVAWIGATPATAGVHDSGAYFDAYLDHDHNGVEDALDRWRAGELSWEQLRADVVEPGHSRLAEDQSASLLQSKGLREGIWRQGGLRVLHLGSASAVFKVLDAKSSASHVTLLHDLRLGAGVQVLAVDAVGMDVLLSSVADGRLLLDRCGTPALDKSRPLIGIPRLENVPWRLGRDWSGSIAILDSGCDTAHGDLGDDLDDDIDGPPPAVGDVADWFPADTSWPLSQSYKVIGWHDVSDDFPQAAGPWDYHYHGTALASVVAGRGHVDSNLRGVAPGARLTVVKFYDFDGEWRTWAGDFLAACAWTLDHADTYRVRTVLCAVNWDQDLGISDAMDAFAAVGIVPVVAMGNQGNDPAGLGFPARLPTVLTIGAVNDQGAVAAYSGRGDDNVFKPDLVAPGGGLLQAAGRIEAADNEPNDSYSGRVGTSLAAAHAAGAVFLLGEALRSTGLLLPPELISVQTLQAVLKFTCAPVDLAETQDGTGTYVVESPGGPDALGGWGLLRVDAAVRALREPLAPGPVGRDTLGVLPETPVTARRLITSPGVRYRVEASPAPGLDIRLEVMDPRWLDGDPGGGRVLRADDQGPGMSESLLVEAPRDSWLMVAVKVVGGQGTVDLMLYEADAFSSQGHHFSLPGVSTGAPNAAKLEPDSGVSLIVPTRVTVDPLARALNVVDLEGHPRAGWPVFLFPHSSSEGGLGQPLAWDLDGLPGDEIVVASQFGSIYFFAKNGSYQEVGLTLNLPLTAPVGMITATGEPLVVVADQAGVLRTWSAGTVLRGSVDLGHTHPLAPAVGWLNSSGGETLVVAYRDGFVAAFDADLGLLPGWPLDLGHDLGLPPVLLDRDGDGLHEVVIPVWSTVDDDLTLRIFHGDGTPAPGDGAVLAAPAGGRWLAVSPPAVGGGYGYGGLNLDLVGLADNGRNGADARWQWCKVALSSADVATSRIMAGLQIQASTDQSTLTLDKILIPTPVEYDEQSGLGNEPVVLGHVLWQDLLYGLTTIPGGVTGWFSTRAGSDPLAQRQVLDVGGRDVPPLGHLGALLVRDQGATVRIYVRDDQVGVQPLGAILPAQPNWLSARGNGRNSGAADLPGASPVLLTGPQKSGPLQVFPNPGGGKFSFSMKGSDLRSGAILEIFDLRGRRLVQRTFPPGSEAWVWDGRNSRGGPLPAGLYLASVRVGSRRFTTRLTLTR